MSAHVSGVFKIDFLKNKALYEKILFCVLDLFFSNRLFPDCIINLQTFHVLVSVAERFDMNNLIWIFDMNNFYADYSLICLNHDTTTFFIQQTVYSYDCVLFWKIKLSIEQSVATNFTVAYVHFWVRSSLRCTPKANVCVENKSAWFMINSLIIPFYPITLHRP